MKYILIVLLCLLLTGCPDGSNKDSPADSTDTIYKGTSGLVTEINEKALPQQIYENENFDLVLTITNKGPIPVASSKVIVVPERGYLTMDDGSFIREESFSFEGKENFQAFDDFRLATYRLKAGMLEPLSEVHTALFSVTTCYDYSAKVFATICIDTDPYNSKPNKKICTPQAISLSNGQGGPLAITSIEPRMVVDGDYVRPQLKVFVQNIGTGSVTSYGNVDRFCSNTPASREDYNVISSVNFDIRIAGASPGFDCVPADLVLKSNQDYILCTLREGIPMSIDNYQTPISIELKYGYSNTDTREVQINKLPT